MIEAGEKTLFHEYLKSAEGARGLLAEGTVAVAQAKGFCSFGVFENDV